MTKEKTSNEHLLRRELFSTGLTKIVIGPQREIDAIYTGLFHAKKTELKDTLAEVKKIAGDLFLSVSNPLASEPVEEQLIYQKIQDEALSELARCIHDSSGSDFKITHLLWLIVKEDALANPDIKHALREFGATDETFNSIAELDYLKIVDVYR